MRLALFFVVLFFTISMAPCLSAVPALDDGHTRIIFNLETGGITGIINLAGDHNFISTPTATPRLWRLVLKKANGDSAELTNIICAKPAFYPRKGSIDLVWKDLSLQGITGSFSITINCAINKTDSLVHFKINITNNSDASIISCVFPEISNLGTTGISDVAFPKYNWGEMFKGLKNRLYGYYPSADTPMQFCTLSDKNDTLYLAAHDPGALYKIFQIQPGEIYSVETSTPNATVAGNDWAMPYDFVLGVYKGDWITACKLYRKWVTRNAPWTAKGPIAMRKDVPPAVKEVGVWLNLAENFTENEKAALEFHRQVRVPVGVHWYSWHSNPFDKDYPNYLPAKPGFTETVKRLKEAGIYSMPYINGRLWDTQNKSYGTAKPHATTNQAGEPNLEDYGSGTKLAVMCLGDSFWQKRLAKLIRQVAEETGVGGIYIDQVAGAPITECYNKDHGHTLGRDKWWIDGYRKSITEARDYCTKRPEGFFVAAENNAEPYMDFVDLFLIWIPRSQNDIPMMSTVYSGYTQYFGTNRASDSDMSFAMLQARDFTWGAQLFWESAYILQPEQKEKLKILSNLARLRYKARKYIVESELMGLVKPTNSIPSVTGKWGSWTSTLEDRTIPAVQATLWKSDDGSYAVIVANADTKDQGFEFDFDPATESSKIWTVQKLNQAGFLSSYNVRKRDNSILMSIPARDGQVLVFKQL